MRYLTTAGLAALMLTGPTAVAQTYYDPYDDPAYARSVQDYNAQSDAYAARVDDYAAQRAAYERQRADYERARAEYDAMYGVGAYARYYGPPPVFRQHYSYATPGYAPCEPARSNRALAGGLIGALAGAAIGSNVAAHGVRTEGAVLGALVGGGIGVAVGRSTVQCDTAGYYYSYNQTYPYRESWRDYGRPSGRYDYGYYSDMGCRLAVAPAEWNGVTDYRYVRVCPDPDGRYRITG
ncbi:MAG TPA: hypothetical protein VFE03_05880 [Caulobacteraceae bacterium]|nr:hypothetical protein [Caulobacteraceae bacterium]